MGRFAKRIMPECKCITKNFSGQVGESGNCGTGHLQKENPQGSILELFLLDTLKTTILMENLIQWWTQSRPFFPNSWYFFRFSKRTKEGSPFLPNCVPVSVVEYASISLNMPKYRWKWLNKPCWLCQGSEHAWWPYMFDRHLKMALVLNKPGLYGTVVYTSVTQSSEYVWFWLHTSQSCLNMPHYALTWLNLAECPWIYLKMPELTCLAMPGFSVCRNINVIILEFLSARFEYPGTLLPFYLLFNMS